jgi:hypothetical protein
LSFATPTTVWKGEVTPEGTTEPQRFSGWLELLRPLEPTASERSEERSAARLAKAEDRMVLASHAIKEAG